MMVRYCILTKTSKREHGVNHSNALKKRERPDRLPRPLPLRKHVVRQC